MAKKPRIRAKKKPGPIAPQHNITDRDYARLKQMARIQCTLDEVCSVMEISERALEQRLKQRGFPNWKSFMGMYGGSGRHSVRRAQFKKALDGNTQMLIWLGKQMLGQTDKVDNTSSDGSMSPPKKIVVRGVKAKERADG